VDARTGRECGQETTASEVRVHAVRLRPDRRGRRRCPTGRSAGASSRRLPPAVWDFVIREKVWGVSETPPTTLQYRCDGPEEAAVLILGLSLGTTWHRL
jgi:hypothetical protein